MEIKMHKRNTTLAQEPGQSMNAKYLKASDCVMVNCDIDILTLGVTLAVLQREFDKAYTKLDDDLQQRLTTAINKAVERK